MVDRARSKSLAIKTLIRKERSSDESGSEIEIEIEIALKLRCFRPIAIHHFLSVPAIISPAR